MKCYVILSSYDNYISKLRVGQFKLFTKRNYNFPQTYFKFSLANLKKMCYNQEHRYNYEHIIGYVLPITLQFLNITQYVTGGIENENIDNYGLV